MTNLRRPDVDAITGAHKQMESILEYYYLLPVEEKLAYLKKTEARALFNSLPKKVAAILRYGFLNGSTGDQVDNWDLVVNYFNQHSRIIAELTENPGTFTMLEKIYTGIGVKGAIDNYFWNCLAGRSLRNRLDAVTQYVLHHMIDHVGSESRRLILNLGSGPGRDTIDMCRQNPQLISYVFIDCIDFDKEAIAKGEDLARQHELPNIKFTKHDIVKLRYKQEADFGLLIGILCPFPAESCVKILRLIKRYFRPGSQVVSACLLDEQLIQDLLCSYLLKEIAGWQLDYKPAGELEDIYRRAGYEWAGVFSDKPTNFYDIGVGIVP